MQKFFNIKIVLLAVFLFALLAPTLASAQIVQCGRADMPACTLCDIFKLFKNIIDFLILPTASNGNAPLVFIIAVFMIIGGGIKYMLAHSGAGSPSDIQAANRLFASVAVGLLIIYGSWIIVNTLLMFPGLLKSNFNGWDPENWYTIDC